VCRAFQFSNLSRLQKIFFFFHFFFSSNKQVQQCDGGFLIEWAATTSSFELILYDRWRCIIECIVA